MDPDPCRSERDAARILIAAKGFGEAVERARRGKRSRRMIGLIDRSIEERKYGVADEFVDHAAMGEDGGAGAVEIGVENGCERRRAETFGEAGEAGDVAEEKAHLAPLAAQPPPRAILVQTPHQLGLAVPP